MLKCLKNKLIISTVLLIALLAGAVLAENHSVTLTVKNNTDQPFDIRSGISPNLLYNIQINGATDTPNLTIDPYGTGVFHITAEGFSGFEQGTIQLELDNIPGNQQGSYGLFSMTISGNGDSYAVSLQGDMTAQSTQLYAVSAVPQFNLSHADLNINTPDDLTHNNPSESNLYW